jgi:hypothetical protein
MSEIDNETVVQPEPQVEPVTDSEKPVEASKSETSTQPEFRDGKWFLEGKRFYTRDETDRVASKARNDAVSNILTDLDVDSLDQVKDVISTLKTTPLTEDGQGSLDVKALKQAVAKREATVEELTSEVNQLRTDLLLKDHMSNLNSAMPNGWTADQKQGVVDLMKARDMFAIEDNSFQLRNGDDFLTVDGEKPDYGQAVELIGKTMGLPFGKKGIDVVSNEGNKVTSGESTKALDMAKLDIDPEYRAAYTALRRKNISMTNEQITDTMVKKQLERTRSLRLGS